MLKVIAAHSSESSWNTKPKRSNHNREIRIRQSELENIFLMHGDVRGIVSEHFERCDALECVLRIVNVAKELRSESYVGSWDNYVLM